MNYFNHLNEELTQEDYLKVRDEFIEDLQKVVDESMRNYSHERNLIVHRGRRYDKIERMLFCGPYGPAYMDTIREYYGT